MRVLSQFAPSFALTSSCLPCLLGEVTFMEIAYKIGPIHIHTLLYSDQHDLIPVRCSTNVASFMQKCRFGTRRLSKRIEHRYCIDPTYG